MSTLQDNRRALDRWARGTGWSDFDTYIRLGGSIGEAAKDIAHRVLQLNQAAAALYSYTPPPPPKTPPEVALALAEAEVAGEPVDAENAQTQGFDHG